VLQREKGCCSLEVSRNVVTWRRKPWITPYRKKLSNVGNKHPETQY